MKQIKDLLSGTGRFSVVAFFAIFLLVAGCSSGSKDDSKAKSAPAATTESAAVDTAAGTAVDAGAAKGALPSDHPAVPEGSSMNKMAESIQKASHANIKTSKEVELSDEIKAKWNQVDVVITDKAAQRSQSVKLMVGSRVQLTDDGYFLTIDAFVPDYAIADSKIVTRSADANNPAMLVSLFENDKQVARGWVFKDFPEFNSYANGRFMLQLNGPGAERPAVPAAAQPQQTH